jgi:hypothetical protein
MNKSHFLTGKAQFDALYRFRRTEITVGPSGYYRFSQLPGHEQLFKGSIEDPRNFVSCNEIGSVRYPHCERYIGIAPGMVLHYYVSRNYLDEMLDIERRLVALLNGFMIAGLRFEIR